MDVRKICVVPFIDVYLANVTGPRLIKYEHEICHLDSVLLTMKRKKWFNRVTLYNIFRHSIFTRADPMDHIVPWNNSIVLLQEKLHDIPLCD